MWLIVSFMACYALLTWLALSEYRREFRRIPKREGPKMKPTDAMEFLVVVETFYPEGWMRLRTAPIPLSVAHSIAARLGVSVQSRDGARIVRADRAAMDAYPELPATKEVAKCLLGQPVEPCWSYAGVHRMASEGRN